MLLPKNQSGAVGGWSAASFRFLRLAVRRQDSPFVYRSADDNLQSVPAGLNCSLTPIPANGQASRSRRMVKPSTTRPPKRTARRRAENGTEAQTIGRSCGGRKTTARAIIHSHGRSIAIEVTSASSATFASPGFVRAIPPLASANRQPPSKAPGLTVYRADVPFGPPLGCGRDDSGWGLWRRPPRARPLEIPNNLTLFRARPESAR
jgi:hypothetical protein